MKKIGVTHIITNLDVGGAERMLIRLLTKTDKKRFTPSVISLMGKGELGAQIRTLGIPLRTINMGSFIPTVKSIVRLSSHVNELKPDLIVGWMYHGNLAATWAASGRNKRSLVWNIRHSLDDTKLDKFTTRQIIRLGALLSKKPKKIIYNSQTSSEQHERIGYSHDNTIVIPNGFELDRFKPNKRARDKIREKLDIATDERVIGLVGRSHPIKNHKGFISSLARFKDQLGGVKIIIAGRGINDPEGDLQEAVKLASLTDIVKLLPQTNQPEILYQAFDLLALPSLSEAFPNVVGEAMACGVPCLVMDVGDAARLVGDTGFVTQRDTREFTEKLMNLLTYDSMRLKKSGERARSRMLENYHIDNIVNRYSSVFNEVT